MHSVAVAENYPVQRVGKFSGQHSGQPLKKLYKDTERDFFMSAEEAREYRLIDKVLPSKKIKSK